MVYVEETGADEARPDDELPLEAWLELADTHAALSADIRVYDSATALREARHLRHAVPATMNERGAARRPFGGRKVSTDWAVPYPRLAEALHIARRFAADAGLDESEALSFLFEHFDSVIDAETLGHRLRLFTQDLEARMA